jgi:hypothetical protein
VPAVFRVAQASVVATVEPPPEPESRWRYVADRQRLRDPVNRHTLAIALIAAPVIFGALVLRALGTDATTLVWTLVGVAAPAAVGGWVHPPSRSLRVRGAVAGLAIAAGALAATYASMTWRGPDYEIRFGLELILPIVIGGLPGAVLYYALVRNHD